MCSLSLFSLFNRRAAAGATVSVSFSGDGIGVARVLRSEGVSPVLEMCDFEPVGDETDQAVALKALTRRHGLADAPCASVLDAGAYNLLLVEAPEVPPEELRAAMRWRIKDLIDFHVDDAVVDVFDVPGGKSAAAARMMYVVAANAHVLRERIALLEQAGLRPSVIDIPELALRNLAALLPEDVAGMALVYLTPETGLILLTHQATVYLARRFPSGLGRLQGQSMPDHRTAGEGWPPGVREVLDALVVEVQRSVDYYDAHFSQASVRHLVLAPMAVQIPGMTDYLARQLGLSPRVLDLKGVVDSRKPIDPVLQARCMPAIGEALRVEEMAL